MRRPDRHIKSLDLFVLFFRWYGLDDALTVHQYQALLETEQHRRVPERQQYLLERLRRWLVRLISGGHLPPPERAAAGRALAPLDDLRPGVGVSPLPMGEGLGLITDN